MTEAHDDDDGWRVETEIGEVSAGSPSPDLSALGGSIIAEAESRFDTLSKALDDQLAAIDQLTSAMGALQAVHAEPDGAITATVDVGGLLSGLTIAPEALEQSPAALAHAIVMAARGAQDAHAAKLDRTREVLENFRRSRTAS